jgi:uncharacterized protein with NRDE domain
MCLIVIGVRVAPQFPLVVAANRDEQHARRHHPPAAPPPPAAWWPDAPHVLGGRDLKAGGAWLAMDRRGRFAAVTNVRDAARPTGMKSRGSLVTSYLAGHDSATEYAAHAERSGPEFGGFNLLLYDGRDLHLSSNRAPAAALGPGLHSFSNAPPGVDWPKTSSARAGAAALLRQESPLEPLFALLAERDDSEHPEQRYLRSHFVVGPVYGTRCSTVVLVDTAGRVTFAERTFDDLGSLVGEVRESFELTPPD